MVLLSTIYFFLGENQKITAIPTLKFFNSGPIASANFKFGHIERLMGDLLAFIDQQMGRAPVQVYKSYP